MRIKFYNKTSNIKRKPFNGIWRKIWNLEVKQGHQIGRCINSLNNNCMRFFLKCHVMTFFTGLFVQDAHAISITTSEDVRGVFIEQ